MINVSLLDEKDKKRYRKAKKIAKEGFKDLGYVKINKQDLDGRILYILSVMEDDEE